MNSNFSFLGFGAGLRHTHFDHFLKEEFQTIQWVEALTENYLPWEDGRTRRPFSTLLKIREKLPMAIHGVSLSIGSTDPVSLSYLKRLKEFAHIVQPSWISDHLCWTGVQGQNLHDLLPLPYNEEAIRHVVQRIEQVQEILGRRILIENVSSYAEFSHSEMPEWEFVSEVANRADCSILLDVNNIYVSSFNHGFDPYEYLKGIPQERVGQIHLAGHTNKGTHLIDTHDEHVCDPVWDLYRWVAQNYPPISTMIEWDDHIPEFEVLEKEVQKAADIFALETERRPGREPHRPSAAV